jgi:hypothetical protein
MPIRKGGELDGLLEALKAAERQRAAVLVQLEHLDGLVRTPDIGAGIERKVRARLRTGRGSLVVTRRTRGRFCAI